MDKPMATRLDEAVIRRIGLLAARLGVSRKAVIERAILAYAQQVEAEAETDIFAETCGVWARDETPEETLRRAREAFRAGMQRHARGHGDEAGEEP